MFAGRDASRGLAKMEVSYSTARVDDLSAAERDTLAEWVAKYNVKYPIVGKIVDSSELNSGTTQ